MCSYVAATHLRHSFVLLFMPTLVEMTTVFVMGDIVSLSHVRVVAKQGDAMHPSKSV